MIPDSWYKEASLVYYSWISQVFFICIFSIHNVTIVPGYIVGSLLSWLKEIIIVKNITSLTIATYLPKNILQHI